MIELRIHVESLDTRGPSRAARLTILRAQLTLLRMRIERGIPVSVQSIARAESLARTLELYEAGE